MEKNKEHTIFKEELKDILNLMIRYNRTDGWIGHIDHKLRFFDGKPSFPAAFVTIDDIKQYIKEY